MIGTRLARIVSTVGLLGFALACSGLSLPGTTPAPVTVAPEPVPEPVPEAVPELVVPEPVAPAPVVPEPAPAPAPRVAPVPDPVPEPEPVPEPTIAGRVTVEGDGAVVLVGASARYPVPGPVPAGEYAIEVSFGGATPVRTGKVTVGDRGAVIRCNPALGLCRGS